MSPNINPTTKPHGLVGRMYVSSPHPSAPPTMRAESKSVLTRTACPNPEYNGSCEGGIPTLAGVLPGGESFKQNPSFLSSKEEGPFGIKMKDEDLIPRA